MATLELEIDASGMQRGAQQAEAALRSVQQQGDRTAKTVVELGGSMRSAFQTAGGSLQIASGLTQVARSLGDVNVASAAFGASRVLLEVGKTRKDFNELAGTITTVTRDLYGVERATTKSASAWTLIGSIVKQHPLLTIATVIGAAASVMSLFGEETKKTANAWEQLGEAMKKAASSDQTARFLGKSSTTGNQRLSALESAIGATFEAGAGPTSVIDASRATGIGRSELMRFLAQQGNRDADTYMRTGGRFEMVPANAYGIGAPRAQFIPGMPNLTLTPQQQREFFRLQYNRIVERNAAGSDFGGVYQFGAPYTRGVPEMFGGPPQLKDFNYVQQSAADRVKVEQEASKAIADNMQLAANSAQSISSSFAAGLADVLMKTSSLKGVLAGIAQQGIRSGIENFAQGFGNLVGKTLTQQQADAGFIGPPAPGTA